LKHLKERITIRAVEENGAKTLDEVGIAEVEEVVQ